MYLTQVLAQAKEVDRSDAKMARYFVTHGNGSVFERGQITARAAKAPTGYLASMPLRENEAAFEKALGVVLQKTGRNEIPILSNEGWFHHKLSTGMRDVFTRNNVEVELFAVIRPPLDYLNSAWWQWGVWTEAALPKFMTSYVPATAWHRHLKAWKDLPGVTRLDVVDLRDNPLKAFKAFLGITDTWDERSNSGSSAALLDFILSQPDHLGRRVHQPGIEFSINRYVAQPSCPKPFILRPKLQQRLINATKDSVRINRRYFGSEEQKEAHVHDPAYSSVEYYEGRVLRGMNAVARPKERYEFRVALSEYLEANPSPSWMPESFDRAAMDEEIRVGAKRFGGQS